jgi:hypothetical protein
MFLFESAIQNGLNAKRFFNSIVKAIIKENKIYSLNSFNEAIEYKLYESLDTEPPLVVGKNYSDEKKEEIKEKILRELIWIKEEFKKELADLEAKVMFNAGGLRNIPEAPIIRKLTNHLVQMVDKYVDKYEPAITFTDEKQAKQQRELGQELKSRYSQAGQELLSKFTKEHLNKFKQKSFTDLLIKLSSSTSRMSMGQKLELAFSVNQLMKRSDISAAYKENLQKLLDRLPTPPNTLGELKVAKNAAKVSRSAESGTTSSSGITASRSLTSDIDPLDAPLDVLKRQYEVPTPSGPTDYNQELDALLGIVRAKSTSPEKINVNKPIGTDVVEKPDSIPREVMNVPEPAAPKSRSGRSGSQVKKDVENLSAEEKAYYDSLGKNATKKGKFIRATPEQRREMMGAPSAPVQRELFMRNENFTFRRFLDYIS